MFNAKLGNKEVFIHNTKYLFLYLQNHKITKFDVHWLCDDEKMRNQLISLGYKNIHKRKSFKGKYYSIRAKYWFYDYFCLDLPPYFVKGAILINLWHGIPLKHIGFDDEGRNHRLGYDTFDRKILEMLRPKDNYIISSGEYEAECFRTAFNMPVNRIKILGSPRLDVLFHEVENSSLFMKEDYSRIKLLSEHGKKLIFYVPTFRDTQNPKFSQWLYSDGLKGILNKNNAILVCKMHPLERNIPIIDEASANIFYNIKQKSDIYPLLRYADFIITDYSSIAFDFLLLDKPILYYVPDINEYQNKCRGFYAKFEDMAAGKFSYNCEDLLKDMSDVLKGIDNYQKNRSALRDRLFKYQDGGNCERIVNFLETLDSK